MEGDSQDQHQDPEGHPDFPPPLLLLAAAELGFLKLVLDIEGAGLVEENGALLATKADKTLLLKEDLVIEGTVAQPAILLGPQ